MTTTRRSISMVFRGSILKTWPLIWTSPSASRANELSSFTSRICSLTRTVRNFVNGGRPMNKDGCCLLPSTNLVPHDERPSALPRYLIGIGPTSSISKTTSADVPTASEEMVSRRIFPHLTYVDWLIHANWISLRAKMNCMIKNAFSTDYNIQIR